MPVLYTAITYHQTLVYAAIHNYIQVYTSTLYTGVRLLRQLCIPSRMVLLLYKVNKLTTQARKSS